jgi:hypothetical protein
MNRRLNLPEIFLLISLALNALDPARISRISAHDDSGRAGLQPGECEQEAPRYGIVKNIDTFNPVRIAFHERTSIVRDLIAARSWREATGVVFGSPGWRADGNGLTSANIRNEWSVRQHAD